MKELNDTDFDNTFKTRITEELPKFEEESWSKMEKKLRKRNRLIYYRYANVLLVLLSFGMGFYLLSKKRDTRFNIVVSKEANDKPNKKTPNDADPILVPEKLEPVQHRKDSNMRISKLTVLKNQSLNIMQDNKVPFENIKSTSTENMVAKTMSKNNARRIPDETNPTQQPANRIVQNLIAGSDTSTNKVDPYPITKETTIQTKIKRKIPISLALVTGPDFSSTRSFVGGKTGISIGATLAIRLTKKMSIQTGIVFGSKNYTASASDYTFHNPNVNKASFYEIDAACKVIEIPLRASYRIIEDQKRSIELNVGLSSYLMVREQYVFKYTAESHIKDRFADISNKNQHYLSVVELSATYNIKLKNEKYGFGIEPYLKIPLTGIGEGAVRLKSSGISLKIYYDFNKK